MLVVAGCEGPPAGAKDAVRRMAALEIMTTAPPQGVQVAYDEELGLDGIASFNPPVVTVVYATSASVQEVDDFYSSTFHRGAIPAGAPYEYLEGEGSSSRDGDVYVDISKSQGPPHYGPDGGPTLSSAPAGAHLYVTVTAVWFPHQDRSWHTRSP